MVISCRVHLSFRVHIFFSIIGYVIYFFYLLQYCVTNLLFFSYTCVSRHFRHDAEGDYYNHNNINYSCRIVLLFSGRHLWLLELDSRPFIQKKKKMLTVLNIPGHSVPLNILLIVFRIDCVDNPANSNFKTNDFM